MYSLLYVYFIYVVILKVNNEVFGGMIVLK